MSIQFAPLSLISHIISFTLKHWFLALSLLTAVTLPSAGPQRTPVRMRRHPSPSTSCDCVRCSARRRFPSERRFRLKPRHSLPKYLTTRKRCLAVRQQPHLKSEIRHAGALGAIPTQPGRATAAPGDGDGDGDVAEGPLPPRFNRDGG